MAEFLRIIFCLHKNRVSASQSGIFSVYKNGIRDSCHIVHFSLAEPKKRYFGWDQDNANPLREYEVGKCSAGRLK